LAKRKAKCGHGKWIPWLKANVEFSEATACNYIRFFENGVWLKSKNVSDLTDARLQLAAKHKAEGARPRGRRLQEPSESESGSSATKTQDPELNPSSNTADELKTGEPETKVISLEVCSKPSQPQPMTGADVFVSESLLRYRENLEKGIIDEELGKVPLKDVSGLPQKVRLEMLIGLLADQLALTLDNVKELKIACNASCQTKGALEHLIHLAHLSWEPLNRIAGHIHFYVAPEPKQEPESNANPVPDMRPVSDPVPAMDQAAHSDVLNP